jgi:transcription antitermination factor NusG
MIDYTTSTPSSRGNGEPASWYALYTRARHEKRVDALLREWGVEAYLPLVFRARRWHDRKKVVPWPLFPSYVFARFRSEVRYGVLQTPGVASVVSCNGDPVPIPDDEIENVRRFATALNESGLQPEPTIFLERGQPVRVVSEPFRGVEGVVLERRGRWRALVQVGVRAIGQGLKVELDVRSLKLIAVS